MAQVLAGLSGEEFSRCAKRYPLSRDTRALSAYDHFATMVFAQLTYRESLRDIEACLTARRSLLYHAGIRGTVKRCNLAYAN
ncbi:IS4 family transposase, partial [Opitutus sp. ER46]